MLRNLSLIAIATAMAAGVFTASQYKMSVAHAADQNNATKITLPISKTSAMSGQQMYGNYCAPCHGVNGKGDGAIGIRLNSRPSDLTILSKGHGGKYPSTHVVSVLKFGGAVPAHGKAGMPMWGPILAKMDRANPEQRELRLYNLSHYVETMQAR